MDIDVFTLSILRKPTTNDCNPQGNKNTLDPYPRVRSYEVDGKISTKKRDLRRPPSSNMRNNKRPNILKDLGEILNGPRTE